MKYSQAVTCSAGCAHDYRVDRAHGLIYGPYAEPTETGVRLISGARFAGLDDSCLYCRGPLPRGRAKRLVAAHPN